MGQYNSTNDFIEVDTGWPTDLERATWWRTTAETLAEWALEELPLTDPERRIHTKLLDRIRLGDAALLAEFCEWRRRHPELTDAMAHAGKLHDARSRRGLVRWLVRTYGQRAVLAEER